MRATLATALRLRTLAVEEARRDLLARLAHEAEAAEAERRAATLIQIEAAVATEAASSDSEVEAFAAWLPHARLRLERSRAARCEAEAACNVGRAAVAAAQAARAAVETLIAEHARAARLQAARAERADMDEAAQRLWPPRR